MIKNFREGETFLMEKRISIFQCSVNYELENVLHNFSIIDDDNGKILNWKLNAKILLKCNFF